MGPCKRIFFEKQCYNEVKYNIAIRNVIASGAKLVWAELHACVLKPD